MTPPARTVALHAARVDGRWYGLVAAGEAVAATAVGPPGRRPMARNPVYPIVPCHRVVGAGFALVGYAGSRAPAALRAKLERLAKEARGFGGERDLATAVAPLHVYPVERAIARARKDDAATRQRSLFE